MVARECHAGRAVRDLQGRLHGINKIYGIIFLVSSAPCPQWGPMVSSVETGYAQVEFLF
jgi:hypothetical protein